MTFLSSKRFKGLALKVSSKEKIEFDDKYELILTQISSKRLTDLTLKVSTKEYIEFNNKNEPILAQYEISMFAKKFKNYIKLKRKEKKNNSKDLKKERKIFPRIKPMRIAQLSLTK